MGFSPSPGRSRRKCWPRHSAACKATTICCMNLNRRTFVLGAAAGLASAQSNEPTQTGMIGVGNRGSLLLRVVLSQPDVKVAAVCDIKPDRLDRAASAAARDNPATYSDYRRILDRK